MFLILLTFIERSLDEYSVIFKKTLDLRLIFNESFEFLAEYIDVD